MLLQVEGHEARYPTLKLQARREVGLEHGRVMRVWESLSRKLGYQICEQG